MEGINAKDGKPFVFVLPFYLLDMFFSVGKKKSLLFMEEHVNKKGVASDLNLTISKHE